VAHVVEAERRQACPAQCSPQDVPQQPISSIGPRSPCSFGSPGNTSPRAVVGHASFQRLSSGIRYAGSGTVRPLFSGLGHIILATLRRLMLDEEPLALEVDRSPQGGLRHRPDHVPARMTGVQPADGA
jgi:hypothetical protein